MDEGMDNHDCKCGGANRTLMFAALAKKTTPDVRQKLVSTKLAGVHCEGVVPTNSRVGGVR